MTPRTAPPLASIDPLVLVTVTGGAFPELGQGARDLWNKARSAAQEPVAYARAHVRPEDLIMRTGSR